jgi:methyltransferase (TIGR00027 family)
MGAGLDSRAYRFEQLKRNIKVFEVDHPATQMVKLKKLQKIFGNIPEHVTYVPVDFNEETLQKLFDFGYSPQLRTLFIWEGVVYYLTAQAVDRTLEFILKSSASGSSIIFDYMYTAALNAAHKRREVNRMQTVRKFTGEGLTFGIEEGQVEEFLQKRGFIQIENGTSEDLKKAYFTGVNQSRAVAPIYAIVHAVVK